MFIPRTLDEVSAFERDYQDRRQGKGGDILYPTVTGMKSDLSGAQLVPQLLIDSVQGTVG